MSAPASIDTVVASFAAPDVAKAAMVELERAGVAPGDVQLLNEVGGGRDALQQGDERTFRWLTRRAVWGGLLGAALVFAIVLLVAAAFGADGLPGLLAAVLCGVLIGGPIGGLVGVGVAMPRNPRAWDTYLLEHGDEVCIAVTLRDSRLASNVPDVLRRAGGHAIEQLPGDAAQRER